LIIPNPSQTVLNPYIGGAYQQATSGLTATGTLTLLWLKCIHLDRNISDQGCYELEGGCFSVYAFEYLPGQFIHLMKCQESISSGFL
jgi:beta-glucan synthesis-associated protein KRE6